MNRHMYRHMGFTLIELLVVISIIALLVSILLPALSKARQSAQNLKCVSTLKQMQTANDVYANEHKEYYVPHNVDGKVYGGWKVEATANFAVWYMNSHYWKYLGMNTARYNANGQSYREAGAVPSHMICPMATLALQKEAQGLSPFSGGYTWFQSYGFNIHTSYNGPPITEKFVGYRRTRLAGSSSKRFVFLDGLTYSLTVEKSSSDPTNSQRYTGERAVGEIGSAAYRHQQGANLAYLDGHVQHTPQKSLDIYYEPWKLYTYYRPFWMVQDFTN